MATLRVVSWNLRTYGAPDPLPAYQDIIMRSILQMQADIVCIQEIQVGNNVGPTIGTPISPRMAEHLQYLCQILRENDTGGNWFMVYSGTNKGRDVSQPKMTDAYAFFIKTTPSQSTYSRRNSLRGIALSASAPVNPKILEWNGFPSRRPGMLYLTVNSGKQTTNINIASFHACTPPNINYAVRRPAAGRAIMLLNRLDDIGGFDGYIPNSQKRTHPVPLPDVNTLVVGDFNFSVNNPNQVTPFPYDEFTNSGQDYSMCVGGAANPVLTTYSPKYQDPIRKVSSYDNIFVLQNSEVTNPLTPSGTGDTFDYISAFTPQLMATYPDINTPAKAYNFLYKRQYGETGLSDHLPVYRDFTLN
jgi:hypothetical protein